MRERDGAGSRPLLQLDLLASWPKVGRGSPLSAGRGSTSQWRARLVPTKSDEGGSNAPYQIPPPSARPRFFQLPPRWDRNKVEDVKRNIWPVSISTSDLFELSKPMTNMKSILMILAVVFSLFGVGCATMQMERQQGTSIITDRVEAGSSVTNGLSANDAVELFRNVANQVGFDVNGPLQEDQTNMSLVTEYVASPPTNGPSSTRYYCTLRLTIAKKIIMFSSDAHGSAIQSATEMKRAVLFEQALDKLGIRYQVNTSKGYLD